MKRFIDKAIDNGRNLGLDTYYNEKSSEEQEDWKIKNFYNKKIVGVDWDRCA